MRGKVKKAAWYLNKFRITPAYAGKSDSKSAAALVVWDHPRLCGEKVQPWLSLNLCLGSPPPMRGKEKLVGIGDFDEGITPAYAGKRLKRS